MNQTIEKAAEVKKGSGVSASPLRVLFVCSGNTCRSPMAAAVLNELGRVPEYCSMCSVEKMNKRSITASSCGISAVLGMPISKNAELALAEAGIKPRPDNNYPMHLSRQVALSDIEQNDMVIGISGRHAMALMSAYPQFATKIYAMEEDIPDPFGGDLDDYKACLEKIRKCIEHMFFE